MKTFINAAYLSINQSTLMPLNVCLARSSQLNSLHPIPTSPPHHPHNFDVFFPVVAFVVLPLGLEANLFDGLDPRGLGWFLLYPELELPLFPVPLVPVPVVLLPLPLEPEPEPLLLLILGVEVG